MKIYNLDYSNFKMHNPTTGEVIIDEECNDGSKSLQAYWLGDYSHFNNETLKAAWIAFVDNNNVVENNDTTFWDALDKFLEEYESQEWIAYKINSSGIACGMINYTTVFIVDKDVEVEEIVENKMDIAD